MTAQPSPERMPRASRPLPGHCAYCGERLNGAFYFCRRCGEPYRPPERRAVPVEPLRLTEADLIRHKASGAISLFWTYFGVITLSGIMAGLFAHLGRSDLGQAFQVAAVLATTIVFTVSHWSSIVPQLRRFGLATRPGLTAVAALAPALLLNYVYHGWISSSTGEGVGDPFGAMRDAGMSEIGLVLLYCAFPAVTEEIAFRGLLQPWLGMAVRPGKALLAASALFAMLHFSVLSFPYLMGLGMLLGWSKLRTGSLYPPMLIHFLHNFVVLEFFNI